MENNVVTDAGVGKAQFSNRLMFTIDVIIFCLALSFISFCIPTVGWLYFSNPQSYDLVKLDILADHSDPDKAKIWRIRDTAGNRLIVTAKLSNGKLVQALNPEQVKSALKSIYKPVEQFHAVKTFSYVLAFFVFIATYLFMAKKGRESKQNQWLRGALPIVSSDKLNKMVRKKGPSTYNLATVAVPKSALNTGILVSGAQGSGKSLAIHDLMTQVFEKRKKAVIYDPTGEFYRAYFRPGKDFFFNPAFEGSVPWSIFSEMKYNYDADTLAQAFLPPKQSVSSGPNGFFEDAARALFSVILLRLTELGSINTSDIADAFLSLPDEEVAHLVKHSVADSAVGGDSKGQRQGVISSISIYLNGIASVKNGSWTITDFLKADDDARFFIYGTDDTKAMFTPLYRLLIAVAFAMIASKQEIVHGEAKYWFFLDEIHTLGDIKLDEHLATLRKFGVAIVAGIQSESQFSSSMGDKRAETAMNCFNTLLQLRVNEAGMMERASKRLGRAEIKAVASNTALGVSKMRDGVGLSSSEQERALVMPSEIGSLPDCQGYLKLPGSYPVAKVDYSSWIKESLLGGKRADRFLEVMPSPDRDPTFIVDRKFSISSDQKYDMRETIKAEMACTAAQEQGSPDLQGDLPPLASYENDSKDDNGTLFFRP